MLDSRESTTHLYVHSDAGALSTVLAGAFGAITDRYLEVDIPTRSMTLKTKNAYGKHTETALSFDDVAAISGTTDMHYAHVHIVLRSGAEPLQVILVPRFETQSAKAAELAQKMANAIGVPSRLDDGFGKLLVWRG
jgi:hypothetical protein